MTSKRVSRRDLPKQILAMLAGGFILFLVTTLTWILGYQLIYADGRRDNGGRIAALRLGRTRGP